MSTVAKKRVIEASHMFKITTLCGFIQVHMVYMYVYKYMYLSRQVP